MADPALLKILLVDDDSIALELITLAFRRAGVTASINCASSAGEAIAYLKGEGTFANRLTYPYPSLLVTDLDMPNGDGFMLLQSLQARPRYRIVPTIVMSSSEDEDDIKACYVLGASTYVVKPRGFSALENLANIIYQMWLLTSLPAVDSEGRQLNTTRERKREADHLRNARGRA